MPAIGLGTFQVKEEAGYKAVKAAIKVRNEKMGFAYELLFALIGYLRSQVSWAGARSLALNASQSILQEGH